MGMKTGDDTRESRPKNEMVGLTASAIAGNNVGTWTRYYALVMERCGFWPAELQAIAVNAPPPAVSSRP